MAFKTKEAADAYHKSWRDANKAHCAAYRKAYRGKRGPAHRRDRYGLTPERFNAMVDAQHGACAICSEVPPETMKGGALHVDHDHDTGKVRGLLCHLCNASLGGFRDSPMLLTKAAWYLARHAANRHSA